MEGSYSRLDLSDAYVELHPRLVKAARAWAPSGTEDDVLQDTWAVVVNNIDRFEGRSKLSTWVMGILWRKSAQRWRERDRNNVRLDSSLDGSARQVDDSPWSDPERRATNRLEAAEVLAVIGDLPAIYRDVVVLRDVLDLSAESAEDQLGISSANQRVRLHRARQRIRDHYDAAASPVPGRTPSLTAQPTPGA